MAASTAKYLKRDKAEFTFAGGLIWTIMILGLCFCLLDTIYLFYAHHIHAERDQFEGTSHQLDEFQQYHNLIRKSNISDSAMRFPPFSKPDIAYYQKNSNSNPKVDYASLIAGKEHVLQILKDADIEDLDEATIRRLPTWNAIVEMYGDKPKIFGLDTCATFQTTIPPEESFVAPAGVFNSGTNLMAELLIANCHLPARQAKYGMNSRGVRWQVNWGKHQSPKWRLEHDVTTDNTVPNQNILPVVTIRDPYLWMQSMCRLRYAAHWFHAPGHCPNLMASPIDYGFLKYAESGEYKHMEHYHHKDPWLIDNVMNVANFTEDQVIVPLYVKYNRETTNHQSLAHLWNDWYNEYVKGDFPRLIVRFEDLLFFGKEVTEQACKCAGGELYPRFRHISKSAKRGTIHGDDKTSLVEALIRYGRRQNATKGMTREDILYAHSAFDGELMTFFEYQHPK